MTKGEQDIVVVIMAGGVGTRFWPLSTKERPKQFLNFFGDRSLLQKSYDRIRGLVSPERVMVLTNTAFVSIVSEELPEIPHENVIGEPMRRDTAAAIALAAALCRKRFGNPIMVVLTADHVIEPVSLFQKTLLSAISGTVERGGLYCFGIEPTYPATGYGYLERGEKISSDGDIEHFQLLRFKEKPDVQIASKYMESGRFYWNSGMFVWSTDMILKELDTHLPSHFKALTRAADYDKTHKWHDALRGAFESIPSLSIDFGVMEKADNVYCVASRFSWDDVGGWLSLENYLPKDKTGNFFRGNVMTLDATNNVIFCEDPQDTVMLVGVEDLVVVRAAGGMLVVHKDQTEDVKKLVEQMGKLGGK